MFRDVSCSGATTDDMTAPQDVTPGPANPPQFNGLDSNTKAVSLTIGGNDIGFVSVAEDCFTPVDTGTPCQDKYVVNGNDEVSNRIGEMAPKVAAVLRGIHTRSPQAKIFLLGYLAILPDTGPGCHPQMPVTDGDVPYLRAKEKQLNNTLKFVTVATGNIYVDAYAASIGRDACQGSPRALGGARASAEPGRPDPPERRRHAGRRRRAPQRHGGQRPLKPSPGGRALSR